MFDSAEANQYEVTFPLLNEQTADGNEKYISKHLNFILTMQSLLVPNLKTINIIEVPALWRFEIPGIMVIPYGFIGKFTATPKGPSKMMGVKIGDSGTTTEVIVPNAWEIHMTFNSLTPPSIQMQRLLYQSKDQFYTNRENAYIKSYDKENFKEEKKQDTATPTQNAGTTPKPYYTNAENSGNRWE